MLQVKGFLIFISGVLLWRSVETEYNELSDLFNKLNDEVLSINHQTAQLAWDTKWVKCNWNIKDITQLFPNQSFDPQNLEKTAEAEDFSESKRRWNSLKCNELNKFSQKFSKQQRRVFNILCRGPKFTRYQQK